MDNEVSWRVPRSQMIAYRAEKAKAKAKQLLHPPAPTSALLYSEFGTRRRRSFKAQDLIIRGLVDAQKEWEAEGKTGSGLAGTSNVRISFLHPHVVQAELPGLPCVEVRPETDGNDSARVDHGYRRSERVQGSQRSSDGYVGGR